MADRDFRSGRGRRRVRAEKGDSRGTGERRYSAGGGVVDGGIVIARGDAEAGRVVAHVETGDRAQPILPVALGHGELMVITTTAAGGGTLKAWTVAVNAEQETVVPLLTHSAKTGSDMTLARVGNRPMLLARRGPEWIAVEPDSGQPITPWPFSAPIEGFVPSADQGFPAVACLAEENGNARKVRFALPQAPGANLGSISITRKPASPSQEPVSTNNSSSPIRAIGSSSGTCPAERFWEEGGC